MLDIYHRMHRQSAGSYPKTNGISCSGNSSCKESHKLLASSSSSSSSSSWPTKVLRSSPKSERYVAPLCICPERCVARSLSGLWSPPRSSLCSTTILQFQKPQRHDGKDQRWLELHLAGACSIWHLWSPRFFQCAASSVFSSGSVK